MTQLICQECRKRYALNERVWKCLCGGLLDLDFPSTFPVKKIQKRKRTMWRYREALPILEDRHIISFDEGFTPLIRVNFQGKPVFIKQDHLFPTGSFKDRGASVLVSIVKETGIPGVVEDSSGNAGCAIAAYCAKGGIPCEVFVPESTSPGKLAQIRSYGAKLNRVFGSREDTGRAALREAENTYYASHSWNPFFFHGTKTFAFEVCEQLGWRSPHSIIVPVGNGTLLLGAYMGFGELLKAGVVQTIPKIIGVQSARCAPLHRAFIEKLEEIPKIDKQETLAEGIAIAEPIRGKQIIRAIRKSHGEILAVEDREIKDSLESIGKQGFYIEPTSAATLAGLSQYLKERNGDEIIVSVFTGHGLKATEKMTAILQEKTGSPLS